MKMEILYRSPFPILSLVWLVLALPGAAIPVVAKSLTGEITAVSILGAVMLGGVPLLAAIFTLGQRRALLFDTRSSEMVLVDGLFHRNTRKRFATSSIRAVQVLGRKQETGTRVVTGLDMSLPNLLAEPVIELEDKTRIGLDIMWAAKARRIAGRIAAIADVEVDELTEFS